MILILGLIFANGLFSGAEIAVVSMRRTRIHQLVEEGSGSARALKRLRDKPERFLATVQVGITLVGVAASAVGGARLSAKLAPVLAQWSVVAPWAEQIALIGVVIVITYLSIVLGELVPKSLALRAGERYAMLIARPLLGVAYAARPAVWFLTTTSNLVLRVFGDRTSFMESRLSAEELVQLLEEAGKAGSVHPRAGEIAERAIEFANLTAADVMVPRNRIVALPRTATADELAEAFRQGVHSRLPVYEDNLDNVVGYVSSKDVLVSSLEGRHPPLEELLRPCTFFPEAMRAVEILPEMQKRRAQLAIIVDERGGTAGILTVEDLIEELVGEIMSEHEREHPGPIRRRPDGTAVVLGTVPVREANRELDLDLPEGEQYTTIAGLCISVAGRIPEPGDVLSLEDGTKLEVMEASPRRIRVVRVHPPPKRPDEDEEGDERERGPGEGEGGL